MVLQKFADFYNVSSDGLEIWVVLVTEKRSSGRTYMNMSAEVLEEVQFSLFAVVYLF